VASKTFGVAPFDVPATASSGLPVVIDTLSPAVCSVAGSTVTVLTGGTCTLQASQPGDATYAAASSVAQSFTVAKQAQTLSGTVITGQLANPVTSSTYTIGVTASSGLAVEISSLTPDVCTISGNAVTPLAIGTCIFEEGQPGDDRYLAATSVTQSFTVSGYRQTIAFNGPPPQALATGTLTLSATATSGLAVEFSSTTPAVCRVSGNTVTFLAAGTCRLRASQPGDTNYAQARSVEQSFTIAPNPTNPPVGDDTGDVPLPPWAYAALGLFLLGGMAMQRGRG
jgi:hypothetical protein